MTTQPLELKTLPQFIELPDGTQIPVLSWVQVDFETRDEFGVTLLKTAAMPIFNTNDINIDSLRGGFFNVYSSPAGENKWAVMGEGDRQAAGINWSEWQPFSYHEGLISEVQGRNIADPGVLNTHPGVRTLLLDAVAQLTSGNQFDTETLFNQLNVIVANVPSKKDLKDIGFNEDLYGLPGSPHNIDNVLLNWSMQTLKPGYAQEHQLENQRNLIDTLSKHDLQTALNYTSNLPDESRAEIYPTLLGGKFAQPGFEDIQRKPTPESISQFIKQEEGGLQRFEQILARTSSVARETIPQKFTQAPGYTFSETLATELGGVDVLGKPGRGERMSLADREEQQAIIQQRKLEAERAAMERQRMVELTERALASSRRPERIGGI